MLPAGGPWAATVDSQIAGVHYPAGLDPAVVARRLLAVNLSDLAAVGAEPAYGLLALDAPAGYDHRRFLGALLAACRRSGVVLAGGDLARAPATAAATLTLIGSRPAGGAWLTRAGARSGHAIWAGGTLGESAAGRALVAPDRPGGGARFAAGRVELPAGLAAGLPARTARAARRAVRRHLLPTPQLALGRALGRLAAGRRSPVGGVIDLSDGLAADLRRLCRESGVGAEVDAARLPVAADFGRLAALIDRDPIDLALGGGEDYVLLFTLAEGAQPPAGFSCRRIGSITANRRLRLIDGDDLGERTRSGRRSRRRPLPTLGWDHLRSE